MLLFSMCLHIKSRLRQFLSLLMVFSVRIPDASCSVDNQSTHIQSMYFYSSQQHKSKGLSYRKKQVSYIYLTFQINKLIIIYKRKISIHTVDPTPFRTPTIVVVRAELTIVHRNMVKLRAIPMIREVVRITKNDREELCSTVQNHITIFNQMK